MKKVIVAIDAVSYSEHAVQYAVEIARQAGGMTLGVFLHDLSFITAEIPGTFDLIPAEYTHIIQKQKEDEAHIQENMKRFNEQCNAAGVKHKLHVYNGTDLVRFLLDESVFADVLVLDQQMSFTYGRAHQLSGFVVDVLEDTHCPVVVVPPKVVAADHVFLCYDGSPSSVYAMKMYSYIFPEWSSKATTLVAFNEEATNHLKESENIKDLLNQHFTSLTIDVKHHDRIGDALLSYFKMQEDNGFIVMGAYGRTAFSRWLKKSMANTIINEVKMPVLITHE